MPEYTIKVSEEVAEYVRSESRRSGGVPEGEVLAELVEQAVAAQGEDVRDSPAGVPEVTLEELEESVRAVYREGRWVESTPKLWEELLDEGRTEEQRLHGESLPPK